MFGFNKKIDIQPEDEVSLKPIFGIEPGKYLAGLYGLLLLVLLFFLLLFPGLTNPGSQYTIRTEPAGAAIRVDDVYQGTSPCTIFIPTGSHRITAVLPGFTPKEQTVTVGNRVLGSLLFPLHKSVSLELTASSPLNPLLEGAKTFAAWSFAGEPSATYQVPLALSEAMYRGAFQAVQSGYVDELRGLLAAAARFAGTTVALRDLSRAQFFAHSAGLSPSPLTTLSALQDALEYINTNPASPQWLVSVLPSDAAQLAARSEWYKKTTSESQGYLLSFKRETPRLGKKLVIGPLQFTEVRYGPSLFYMAEQEVTQRAWDAFVAEHPEWAKNKKDHLMNQGLVGPDYLELPDISSFPQGVVPGISFYAARAFCAWLDSKVPETLRTLQGSQFTVRLPTEAEWFIGATYFGNSTFSAIIGGLWEWCETPYVPFPGLTAPVIYQKLLGSPEYVVKGGSWANRAQTIQAETRASLPPDSSSAFVGFRPVFAIGAAYE